MNNVDFSPMRRAMIDSQLRTNGIVEPWILAAMGAAAREEYVPADRASTAYQDRGIPLGNGRMLNPPLTTAQMLSAAEVVPDDNILLIGGGTGYMAALVAGQAAAVTVVEESPELVAKLKEKFGKSRKVNVVEGPLSQGAAKSGPYSLVIIDGAIGALPEMITEQMADGGRVVSGYKDGSVSRLAIGYKHASGVTLRAFADGEVASLPGFEHAKEFIF